MFHLRRFLIDRRVCCVSDGEQSVIVPCQALLIIEELERFRDSFRELLPLAVRSWVPTEDTLASASKCRVSYDAGRSSGLEMWKDRSKPGCSPCAAFYEPLDGCAPPKKTSLKSLLDFVLDARRGVAHSNFSPNLLGIGRRLLLGRLTQRFL